MRLPAAAPNSWPNRMPAAAPCSSPCARLRNNISASPVVTGQPAPTPEPPVQERARQLRPHRKNPELTYAQRQAMAYRAAAERRYGDTFAVSGAAPPPHREPPAGAGQRTRQAAAQLYEQPAAPRL